MTNSTVANTHQQDSQPSSSWAKIARDGAAQQQQQSDQERQPPVTPSTIPQQDGKAELIQSLRNQLEATAVVLEQERKRADECSRQQKETELKLLISESQLDIARKKLLGLQPPQDISDDQVKYAFNDLCHNIEDWVDLECGNVIGLEQRLCSQYWTNQEMEILERHMTDDDIKLSQKFPNITANLIMNMIFSFVYECCLREEKWCVWGSPRDEIFINSLIEAMSKNGSADNTPASSKDRSGLNFSNDPQLRRWRSDTFKALQLRKGYFNQRRSGLTTSSNELSWVLKHFANKAPGRIRGGLHDKIVTAAHMLADLIKASTNGYRFDFVVNSSSVEAAIGINESQMHNLLDAQTGIEIDGVHEIDGRAGILRLCVFPALERVQDNGERLQLSKVLVVLERSAKSVEDPGMSAMEKTSNESLRHDMAVDSRGQTIRSVQSLGECKSASGDSPGRHAENAIT